MAATKFYPCTSLTAGVGGLKSIDGTNLTDKDAAFVGGDGHGGFYELDVDSGLTEAIPNIVAPTSNAGDKRWILVRPGGIGGDVDADWFYRGTGEFATAINEAIEYAKTATNYAPFVRLKNKTYQVDEFSINWSNRVTLAGAGVGSTIIEADAAINAIEVDYGVGVTTNYVGISDLSIIGGKNGIRYGGGYYMLHSSLRNIYIEDPAENGVLIDDTDIQSSIFENVRTHGGQRGWLVKGVTSANRNIWMGGESYSATEAGMELDGSAVTYAIAGPVMINTIIENNEKYGLVLKNVNVGLFLGLHLEGNGTNVTGGPWANVALYGKSAILPTTTLTFDTCTNVASGANQGGLALQVKDGYVRGPIYFRNCILRPTDIVDLGTGLNSGITQYTAFINDGLYPITVQGDTAQVHNIPENMVINGSFELWNEGTSVAPTGWQLYGAGAAVERVTGLASPYAAKLTTDTAGHNLRQLGMSKRLKPNTIYWVQLKYSMDAGSTAGFTFNFINSSAATVLFTETSAIAGTGTISKKVLMRTTATFTELTGYNITQSGAGDLIVTLDDVIITEGIERFSQTVNRYDSTLNGGLVTLRENETTTVVADTRVTATTIPTFEPKTANAAAETGGGTMYVSTQTAGTSFTITHANSAQTDRTFGYVLNNG